LKWSAFRGFGQLRIVVGGVSLLAYVYEMSHVSFKRETPLVWMGSGNAVALFRLCV
jgi:hypothetical protein